MADVKQSVSLPVPQPLPVPVCLMPILNIRFRHFQNSAMMMQSISQNGMFDEKTSVWNIVKRSVKDVLTASVVHAMSIPDNPDVECVERIIIPSGNTLCEIALPSEYNEEKKMHETEIRFAHVHQLREIWDSFATAFIQEMKSRFEPLPGGLVKATQILKSMFVVHVEKGRSYVELQNYVQLM